jgi:hypothetical protein
MVGRVLIAELSSMDRRSYGAAAATTGCVAALLLLPFGSSKLAQPPSKSAASDGAGGGAVGGGSAAAATAAGMEATVPENCTAANFCRSYLSLMNARTSRSVDAVVGRFQGGGGKFAS